MNAFEKFINGVSNKESDDALEKIFEEVNSLEKEADNFRRKAVNDLLNHSILPQTRTEILEILLAMDKIPNACQDISRQIICENTKIPQNASATLKKIVNLTKEQLEKLFDLLKILFNDYDKILAEPKLLREIGMYEKVIDEEEFNIIAGIFNEEIELVRKIYIKKIVNDVCDISDLIEDIVDSIHIMAVLRKV